MGAFVDIPNPVIRRLRERYLKLGRWNLVADEFGVQATYLCNILQGKQPISAEFAKRVGFNKKTVYAEIGK